jgi:hypothetical protein
MNEEIACKYFRSQHDSRLFFFFLADALAKEESVRFLGVHTYIVVQAFLNPRHLVVHTLQTPVFHTSTPITSMPKVAFAAAHEAKTYCFS